MLPVIIERVSDSHGGSGPRSADNSYDYLAKHRNQQPHHQVKLIAKGYKDDKENSGGHEHVAQTPYMRIHGVEKPHLQRHGHAIIMSRGREDTSY